MLQDIRSYLNDMYYAVGICKSDNICINSANKAKSIEWVTYPNYKDNWLADPFIFRSSGETLEVLAEEFENQTQKGRLVKIGIDKATNRVVSRKVILQLDTHLSFPIFINEGSDIYVYPENFQSGSLKMYKYNKDTDTLENPHVIIDEPMLDTAIVRIDSYYFAFGVVNRTGSLDDTKILDIYRSKDLLGKYEHFQSIKNDYRQERGAGRFFYHNGMLIRPVQNCEGGYGTNVIFKHVKFHNNVFSEEVIGELNPSTTYPEGLHTFNQDNSITIIDGYKYKKGNVITFIKRLIVNYFPKYLKRKLGM